MQRILCAALVLCACADRDRPDLDLQAQRVRVGNAQQDGSYLSLHILGSAGQAAVPCAEGTLTAEVRYRAAGEA